MLDIIDEIWPCQLLRSGTTICFFGNLRVIQLYSYTSLIAASNLEVPSQYVFGISFQLLTLPLWQGVICSQPLRFFNGHKTVLIHDAEKKGGKKSEHEEKVTFFSTEA